MDNNSTDETAKRLAGIAERSVRVVPVSKNGVSAVLFKGLAAARYPVIITIDADLQNDPRDVPLLLEAIDDGADFVCGVQRARHMARRLISSIANAIRRRILRDPFRDTACGYRAFKKSCMDVIPFYDGVHRFFPILVEARG